MLSLSGCGRHERGSEGSRYAGPDRALVRRGGWPSAGRARYLEAVEIRRPSSVLFTQKGGSDEQQTQGAADSFLRWAIGPDYRAWLDRLIPGAYQQV
jgi:hypothetical protein